MCGIVGIVQYSSPVSRRIRAKALKILFSDMMLKTEPRGDDATGIYQVQADGDWMLAKKGQKVTEWLHLNKETSNDPVFYSDFVDTWEQHPHEMSALVGHCRKATVGSKGGDNGDNHPFAVQLDSRNALLGVHNGTLNNHETIFAKLGGHLKRQGNVDSEAIFHFLYYLTKQGTLPVEGEMLKHLGERIDGAYAVITVNSRFPNQIVTFRDGRPMEFFMIRPLNLVAIVSEKRFAEDALDKYEFIRTMLDPELPKLEHTDRMLAEKDYRIFDTARAFPMSGSLSYSDLDAVSTRGEVKGYNTSTLTDWESKSSKPTTIHSPYSSGLYSGYGQPPTPSAKPQELSARVSKSPTENSVVALSASTKEEGKGSVVEVEIEEGKGPGEKEAAEAFIRAKSLGLAVKYDTVGELAKSLGKTIVQIEAASRLQLANLAAMSHFTLGYALGRVDSEAEIEEVRRKGRDLHKTMEHLAEKLARASRHIWEIKHVLQVAIALTSCRFKLSDKNFQIAIKHLPGIRDKEGALLSTAVKIFGDKNVMKRIEILRTVISKPGEEGASRSE